MAAQVITRDYGYITLPTGDSFTINDGVLTVYDEGTEAVASFAQWVGVVLKTDS